MISFQDSSAIVGISSAKLQKLHQGKVPNIEAAFEKVCQRKIKIHLKVASATTKKSTSDRASAPPTFPPKTEVVESQTARNLPAQPVSKSSAKVIPINRNVSKSDRDTIPTPSVVTPVTPPSSLATTSLKSKTDTAVNKVTVLHPPAATEPVVTNGLRLTSNQQKDENLSPNGINRDDNPDILQRAIEDLTQSFEGELVELDAVNLSQFSDSQIESDRIEAIEELTPPKIATGTENLTSENNINHPPFIAFHTVVNNRPDLSEYDDEDDIPF